MLIFAAMGVFGSGCVPPGSNPTGTDEQDRALAQQKLQQMLAAKQQAAQQEQRLRQKEQQEEAARQAEAAKPHYPPGVLAAAAKPRVWAPIKVEKMGIQAVLNSTWVNGQLNYRVALLGQRPALEMFTNQWQEFKVNFADQSGTPTFEFIISPSDFQWDPPSTNGGIPTMETRGTAPCELPQYSEAVQWNLIWS